MVLSISSHKHVQCLFAVQSSCHILEPRWPFQEPCWAKRTWLGIHSVPSEDLGWSTIAPWTIVAQRLFDFLSLFFGACPLTTAPLSSNISPACSWFHPPPIHIPGQEEKVSVSTPRFLTFDLHFSDQIEDGFRDQHSDSIWSDLAGSLYLSSFVKMRVLPEVTFVEVLDSLRHCARWQHPCSHPTE